MNGVDYYNLAATSLPDYFPVNFVLRGERGDVLGARSVIEIVIGAR